MAKRKKRIRRKTSQGQLMEYSDEGLLWVQEVQVRPRSERKPMAGLARWKRRVLLRKKNTQEDTPKPRDPPEQAATADEAEVFYMDDAQDGSDDESHNEDSERKQYTFTTTRSSRSFYERFIAMTRVDTDEHSYAPSKLFMRYINWTFRSSFFVVFLSFLAFFMLLIFLFGEFLNLAGNAQPECITVAGEPFGTNPDRKLADAFALSWTTFTTVGYGMTYTTTGNEYDDQRDCSAIVFLCTAESFIGLLYAGMCAAILFGKIGRIQSHAQVSFSDAICIQYGAEVGTSYASDDDDEDEGADLNESFVSNTEEVNGFSKPQDRIKYQCPMLKFQVVNQLCNQECGEIMDAMLKVLATNNKSTNTAQAAVAKYMKVDLKEFEHPFFNRVWHGRHTLDASSPLLTPLAKQRIRHNGGYWPADMNNPGKIRDSLNFTDFIVTLFGISNVSASTVHAYKRYKYEDVLIGYEFAPLLYKHSDTNRLKVDMTLIDDVIEQRGGGAESFDDISTHSLHYPSLHAPRAPAKAKAPRAPAKAKAPRAPAKAQAPRAPAKAQAPRAPAKAQAP